MGRYLIYQHDDIGPTTYRFAIAQLEYFDSLESSDFSLMNQISLETLNAHLLWACTE